MSDKNLQAGVELQVSTPGVDSVARLKKEVSDLLVTLGNAGAMTSAQLDKAAEKAEKAAARSAAAREKEAAAQATHARKIEVLEQKMQLAREKAEARRVQLETTANARIEASRNNLAAVELQANARQEAADTAAAARRERREQQAFETAKRRIESLSAQRAAAIKQQVDWLNGGRVQNPNAAWDMAHKENGKFDAAKLAAVAELQAQTFGGRFKTAMTNWGKSASESFVQSFKSSMSSGMASIVAGMGALFAAKKVYHDNVDEATIKYGLQSAYAHDDDKGVARGAAAEKRLMQMSNRFGVNYAQTGKESIGFISAAAGAGMSDQDTFDTLQGFSATKAARHLTDGQMNRALRALSEMTGKDFVLSKELKQQLNNDIPGFLTDVEQFLKKNTGGLVNNGDDMTKLLSGKLKNADGQVVRLDSEKFAPAMGRYLSEKNNATAVKAAETSPMAQVNRFANAIFELNKTFGNSGAAEGFGKAIKEVVKTLESPEIRAMFQRMGVSAKQVADSLAPAITEASHWARQNTGLIQTIVGLVAKVTGASLAFRVLMGAVGFVLSPIKLVAGVMLTLGGGVEGLKSKALSLYSGLQTLGSTPTWSTVKTKVAEMATSVRSAFTSAGTGARSFASGVLKLGSDLSSSSTRAGAFRTALANLRTSMTNAGTAASKLGARLKEVTGGAMRALNGAVRAAALAAATSQAQSLFSMKHGKNELAKLNGTPEDKLTDSQLERKLELSASIESGLKQTRDGFITGGIMDLFGLKDSKAGIEEGIAQFKEDQRRLSALLAKRDEARMPKQSDDKPPTGPTDVTTTSGDAKGGRKDHAKDAQTAAAMKESADQGYNGTLENIKSDRAEREESLKLELEQGLKSYEDYYNERHKLADAAIDAEKKALQDKYAGEKAALQKAGEHPQDAADARDNALRQKALEKKLTDDLLDLEAKRKKEQAGITLESEKETKSVEKRFAALRGQVDKLNGRTDPTEQYGAIEAAHQKDYDEANRADPDGSKGYKQAVDNAVEAEKRVADFKALQERIAEDSLSFQNKDSEIALKLQQGMLTRQQAEQQTLDLKKQQAAENIRLLEQELQLNNPVKVREQIEQEILKNKQVMLQVTAQQQGLENSIRDSMSSVLESLDKGKGILGSLKSGALSVTNTINKAMSDSVADSTMKWLKGKDAGGEGDNWLKGLGNMLGFGSKDDKEKKVGKMTVDTLVVQGMEGMGGSGASSDPLSGLLGMITGGDSSAGDLGAGGMSTDWSSLFASSGATFGDVGGGLVDSIPMSAALFDGSNALSSAAQAVASSQASAIGVGGVNVNMTISTPDVGSFRASQSQVMSQMQTAAQLARYRNG